MEGIKYDMVLHNANVKKACKNKYVNGVSKYNEICIMSSEKESTGPAAALRPELQAQRRDEGRNHKRFMSW